MEKLKEMFIKLDQNHTNIWLIVIILIFSVLIIGGVVYMWQRSNQEKTEQKLKKNISVLKKQVSQLEHQNDLLQKQENESETQNTKNLQSYELINGHCNKKECLFNRNGSDYPIGIATVRGYYTKYLDKAWGKEQYCDSLTLTGGTQELLNSLIRLVDKGNTVHDKNELNQPIVNFSLNKLNKDDKQKFLSSTKDNPVELIVFQQIPTDRGAGVCFSAFDILEVNQKGS